MSWNQCRQLVVYSLVSSEPIKIVLQIVPKILLLSPINGLKCWVACLTWLNWNDYHDKEIDQLSHPERVHLRFNHREHLISIAVPIVLMLFITDPNNDGWIWFNILLAFAYPYLVRLSTKLVANIAAAWVVQRASTLWILMSLPQSVDRMAAVHWILSLLPCGVVMQWSLDTADIKGDAKANVQTIPMIFAGQTFTLFTLVSATTLLLSAVFAPLYLNYSLVYVASTFAMICVVHKRPQWCKFCLLWNEYVVLNVLTTHMISSL